MKFKWFVYKLRPKRDRSSPAKSKLTIEPVRKDQENIEKPAQSELSNFMQKAIELFDKGGPDAGDLLGTIYADISDIGQVDVKRTFADGDAHYTLLFQVLG